MKIKIAGKEYEAGSQEHFDALAALEAKASKADDETARADKAEAERDDARKQVEDLEAKASKHAEEIEAKADAVVKLREDARRILGADAELPKGERAILEAVVKHDAGGELDLSSKSDDYVRARFDAALERVAKGGTPSGARMDDFRKAADAKAKGDSEPKKDSIDSYHEKNREAWKQPLITLETLRKGQ